MKIYKVMMGKRMCIDIITEEDLPYKMKYNNMYLKEINDIDLEEVDLSDYLNLMRKTNGLPEKVLETVYSKDIVVEMFTNTKVQKSLGKYDLGDLMELGYDPEAIVLCSDGKQKTHKGRIFKVI